MNQTTSAIAAAVPATTSAPSLGTAGLLQAGSGLVVIIGLIFLVAWIARRLGLQRHSKGHLLKVVGSTAVGRQERVVIVEVADTWLVLGVTAGQINTLHNLPAQTRQADATTAENTDKLSTASSAITSFGAAFSANFAQKLREATHRAAGKPGVPSSAQAIVASSFINKAD